MNKEFTRMQKLAGILTEGLYTSDEKAPMEAMSHGKMTKKKFKEKIKEMMLDEETPGEEAYAEMGSMDEDLFEAKKDEESDTEDVIVADTEEGEVPAEGDEDMAVSDTQVDVNMDGIPDVDTGSAESKKAFTGLVDAYNAAKELGDPKLTQILANALTYYNKNIILKTGQQA